MNKLHKIADFMDEMRGMNVETTPEGHLSPRMRHELKAKFKHLGCREAFVSFDYFTRTITVRIEIDL